MIVQHSKRSQQNGTAARHLNQRDLAARWGISVRTLERWRWLGQGPAFLKLGGRIAYRVDDVEAFECAQRKEATAV
jgi:predicted site-specific integrase-resolvase